jgi:hypothetical protein
MARHWEDREALKAGIGRAGQWGHLLWFLGVIFAVLGIIAGVANTPIGLSATSWLLLAIFTMLAGITFFMGWMVAWYLNTIDQKK